MASKGAAAARVISTTCWGPASALCVLQHVAPRSERRVCGERAVTAMSPVQVSYSKSRRLSQQINTFVTTVYYFFIDTVRSNKSFPLERFGVLVFHRSLSLSCCIHLLNPICCIPFSFPWAELAFTCLMMPFAGTLCMFLCNHVQKPNNLLS